MAIGIFNCTQSHVVDTIEKETEDNGVQRT